MSRAAPNGSRFDARRALAGVGVFTLVGVAQVGAVLVLGHGLACPVLAATGVRCPLCGTTTAVVALLHGDLRAAVSANAFSLAVLVGLAFMACCWVVEALGGPAVRAPGRLRRLWGDRLLAVLAVVGLAFGVARVLL